VDGAARQNNDFITNFSESSDDGADRDENPPRGTEEEPGEQEPGPDGGQDGPKPGPNQEPQTNPDQGDGNGSSRSGLNEWDELELDEGNVEEEEEGPTETTGAELFDQEIIRRDRGEPLAETEFNAARMLLWIANQTNMAANEVLIDYLEYSTNITGKGRIPKIKMFGEEHEVNNFDKMPRGEEYVQWLKSSRLGHPVDGNGWKVQMKTRTRVSSLIAIRGDGERMERK
jgi:hypothetical protein